MASPLAALAVSAIAVTSPGHGGVPQAPSTPGIVHLASSTAGHCSDGQGEHQPNSGIRRKIQGGKGVAQVHVNGKVSPWLPIVDLKTGQPIAENLKKLCEYMIGNGFSKYFIDANPNRFAPSGQGTHRSCFQNGPNRCP